MHIGGRSCSHIRCVEELDIFWKINVLSKNMQIRYLRKPRHAHHVSKQGERIGKLILFATLFEALKFFERLLMQSICFLLRYVVDSDKVRFILSSYRNSHAFSITINVQGKSHGMLKQARTDCYIFQTLPLIKIPCKRID